ncbi:MAG: hypothetical protein U1G07_01050 [Verrucomicrobiota bacterium]
MAENWFLLHSGKARAGFNMALDEALLESAAQRAQPVLRFYGWTEPAATFGYAQRIREVSLWTPLRPLIRRPTGGGLVPHDADWTYSLAFPPRHAWFGLKAVESYQRLHEWIHAAFASLGIQTELSPLENKPAPGRCFIGAERFDLLRAGVKIAGAAQRRNRQGLLIQGSVQPGQCGCDRDEWASAMLASGSNMDGMGWEPLVVDQTLSGRAEVLAAEKYSQAWYNERR